MKYFIILMLLLCNFYLSAQQFFFNKTTKQYNTQAYIDSVINSCNAASTLEYPYILKNNIIKDSTITTWVTWPMAKRVSKASQKYFIKILNTIAIEKIPKGYLKNKVIVINFWADFCQPCLAEMPLLNKIVKEFEKDTNIVFIAPCLNTKNNCKKEAIKNNFAFETISNGSSNQLLKALNINWYPTTVIINKKGVITHYLHQTGNTKMYPIITEDTFYLTLLHTLKALQK